MLRCLIALGDAGSIKRDCLLTLATPDPKRDCLLTLAAPDPKSDRLSTRPCKGLTTVACSSCLFCANLASSQNISHLDCDPTAAILGKSDQLPFKPFHDPSGGHRRAGTSGLGFIRCLRHWFRDCTAPCASGFVVLSQEDGALISTEESLSKVNHSKVPRCAICFEIQKHAKPNKPDRALISTEKSLSKVKRKKCHDDKLELLMQPDRECCHLRQQGQTEAGPRRVWRIQSQSGLLLTTRYKKPGASRLYPPPPAFWFMLRSRKHALR